MASEKRSAFKKTLLTIRDSGKTKNFLVFLVFVGIAAVFWVVMSLNDDTQDRYEVKLVIENIPDSVTFINLPPEQLYVTVKDKGTNLVRYSLTGAPELKINFDEYVEGNYLRVTHPSLNASLRHIFGSMASIATVSPDSLKLNFTRLPGRNLPIELIYDVTAAPGMVLAGNPQISSPVVAFYSATPSDTIHRLFTDKITLRNIEKNTTVKVPLAQLPGSRTIPSTVDVTFNVEPLVKKESEVPVVADVIPAGRDILFFPSKVKVSYYVPMSRYSDAETPIKAEASFNEAVITSSNKVGVKIVGKAPYMSNVELLTDSVEYTLVRAK